MASLVAHEMKIMQCRVIKAVKAILGNERSARVQQNRAHIIAVSALCG